MKKTITILILLIGLITGCSNNKYYLTYDMILSEEDIDCRKHYDVDENFEYSKVVLNIYHLIDHHWKSVKSFEGKNIKYIEFTVLADKTTDMYIFLDDTMYSYQLENEENRKYYTESWSRWNTNDEKEQMQLGYDEKILAFSLQLNEEEYYQHDSFYKQLVRADFNNIDLNEEYENYGCDPYLLTYQFFK